MKSKKELLGLKDHHLTPEERESLGDMELNICDKCGSVESTYELVWVDSEEFWDQVYIDMRMEKNKESENLAGERLCKKGHSAICNVCFDEEMILDQSYLDMKAMLDHLNKIGLAKLNTLSKGLGDEASTLAWGLERSIRNYEEHYKMTELEYKKPAWCVNCQGKPDCKLEVYQDCQYNPENKE
jgi:hypothetical protein